ncbi:Autophagy-related protein 13 [Phytophthora cactorum]|nr:Autophagy-related protein 13 [Phytophthora cactorum]
MMSSVDMSNSSRSSHPSSQQFPGSDSRYNGQNMRYAAPPPRSSTGRAKTEQVVLEFLYKAAELIVQSRVNFHAEPDLRRSNRRARFNLDIEEVQVVRDSMAPWKEDVRLPLAIDIFWDTGSHKVLLERWSVTFAADGESSSAHLGSTQDVIQQLKEVCKRISVLLRALFSFMRQLPAHRLFTQSYPSMLSYTMHTAPASDATRAFEAQRVATSGYSFVPIMTPFGLLKVTAIYRRDCDQFTEQQEQAAPSRILPDNFIIQDYVPGSPELTPASAPVTSAAMTSSPLRVTDLRTGSFVPVSDTEQFDVGTLQRRRSSPRSIPAAHQQFSNTGLVGDNVGDDDGVVQSQPGMSKPMAIPRVSSKGGIATAAGREVGAQRQQQLWEGHADRHDTEIGFHSSTTSFDEQPASNSSAAYHPMSTPPRHPKTVSLLRNDRTSPALSHKPFLESSPVPGSFERFALDSGLPSQVQQHTPERRKSSFSGAFVSDSAESSATAEAGDGVQRSEDATPAKPATKTEAITIHPRASNSPAEGLPAFLRVLHSKRIHVNYCPRLRGMHTPRASFVRAPATCPHSSRQTNFNVGMGRITRHSDAFGVALVMLAAWELSSATTAVDSVSTGAGSTLSGASLDTASVGNFLHQLKSAPRLSKGSSTLTSLISAEEDHKASDSKQEAVAPPSMFDDELAGFRNLRDELSQML